jgi:hypothetical protein
MTINFEALADPFPAKDVEWRAQSTGKTSAGKPWIRVLAYVDNRAIMDRLDEVCGPENWRNEYAKGPEGGILCGLSIYSETRGEWVTKWDGAENTDIEGVKGGLSGAMKRAGYQWGIGRYLYNLEEAFGIVTENGAHYVGAKPDKHGAPFKWNPPVLPAWALPGGAGRPGPVKEKAPLPSVTTEPAKTSLPDLTLPGTPDKLGGHGGKKLSALTTDELLDVRKKLDGKKAYAAVIAAIDARLTATEAVTE